MYYYIFLLLFIIYINFDKLKVHKKNTYFIQYLPQIRKTKKVENVYYPLKGCW